MICSRKKIFIAVLLTCAMCGMVHAQSKVGSKKPSTSPPFVQPQNVVVDQPDAKPGQDQAAKESVKEQREESRNRIELGLSVAIAVAALVQATFAILQWFIYKAQLKFTMPLVVVDWNNDIHLSPIEFDPPEGGQSMSHYFYWTMRNVGQTPAFVTDVSVRFVSVPKSQSVTAMSYAEAKPFTGEPLSTELKAVRRAMAIYTPIEDVRTYEKIETAYRSGSEILFAFGYIKFSDRSGSKHTSSFCFQYNGWPTPNHEYDGWSVAKDKQNKYT